LVKQKAGRNRRDKSVGKRSKSKGALREKKVAEEVNEVNTR
jgi:hypothetical protein